MDDYDYVSAEFSAWHTDPLMDEGRHAHVWKVTIYWPPKPFRDGRSMRVALQALLDVWAGADLPPEMWSDHDIARTVLLLLGNGDVRGVRVERAEGFGAVVWRR